MFHFTGFRVLFPTFPNSNQLVAKGFGKRRQGINPVRLPHSEISGSKRMCRSPKLIAACHVLHRLLAPRHPLCALQSLIPCLKSAVLSGKTVLQPPLPCNSPAPPMTVCAGFAVKIDVFGNQNIFKDRKNSSQDCSCFRGSILADFPTLQFLAVNQIIFLSIWMSKSGLFSSIRAEPTAAMPENGGPDRTRTYDPRLIKAVL